MIVPYYLPIFLFFSTQKKKTTRFEILFTNFPISIAIPFAILNLYYSQSPKSKTSIFFSSSSTFGLQFDSVPNVFVDTRSTTPVTILRSIRLIVVRES